LRRNQPGERRAADAVRAWPGPPLLVVERPLFFGMALNNVLLFVDRVIVSQVDWSVAPNLVMLASIAALIYGLIWETT
jgi:hypothetical protein